MATSGRVETNHVAATSRRWYWELIWNASYSGNTATVSWEIYARCENGTSGSTWVANWGFGGNVHNTGLSYGSDFYKDAKVASGSFSLGGGQSFGVNIEAHPYSGSYTSSGSWTFTLDNKVVTPTVTCSASRGLNSIAASMSVTNNGGASIVDRYIDLFTNSACTNKVGTISGASGTFTGLTPNTTYYARANASNGTYRGYSSVVTVSTYDIARITSAPNIEHGNGLTVGYSNPSGASLQIGLFKTDGSTALAGYRACSGSSYTFSFTDAELDAMYRQYGNSNSFKARVYIKTAGSYLAYAEITITLKGNQKTARINISSSWRRGKSHINISGTWHKGVVWENINGTWHRCI